MGIFVFVLLILILIESVIAFLNNINQPKMYVLLITYFV